MIPEHDGIGLKALTQFVLITFLITWSIAGFYIFFNDLAVRLLGQISGTHPLFFLAVWAPAVAAVAVILHRRGATGLKLYLQRLRLWRIPAGWLLFILVGIPGVFFLGALIKGAPLQAPIFNSTGGSILWPMLYHFQLNNPMWPDAQPYDTYVLLGVSVLILVFRREAMFSNKEAYSVVIPSTIRSKAFT